VRETARQDDPITRAPRDRALPRLEHALDAESVRPRLEALIGEHGTLSIRVLKHTPGKRCVVGYELEDGTRLVAKLYRKERARRHAATLAALGQALRAGARTPRLLDCWEDLGLVLQEWVPGQALPDYAEFAGRTALVDRLAGALADFHAAPVHCGQPADLAAHVRRTCRPGMTAIAAAPPEGAERLAALERAIVAREAALPATPSLCHGDFGPRQVFVDREAVYFVDLDGLCQGDPSLDVASFRVGLETHLGSAGRELGDRFLEVYLQRRGIEALPTLVHHEAFCDLRRAVILARKREPGWENAFRLTLERGRTRLSAASS
jgi:aminoglycoside phosphotransferase (APT) family kinase protein